MTRLIALVVSCMLSVPALAFAQHEGHGAAPPDAVGSASVKFETSCAPAVQRRFQQGGRAAALVLVPRSDQGVRGRSSPPTGTARWRTGASRSASGAIRSPASSRRSTVELTQGRDRQGAGDRLADAARARVTSTRSPSCSPRADPGTHAARIARLRERRWRRSSRDNPDDTEAQIFYALAVNQTAPPTDKTYAQNLKAAGILEPLFKKMPKHPGLAHYIIHAYDVPPLADKALVAARSYASLAPAVPHALHMPSHTFTRVGFWKESIDTNRARRKRRARATAPAKSCTRSTTRPTRICRSRRTRRPRRVRRSRAARWPSARRRRAGATRSRWRRSPRATRSSAAQWADAAALTPRPAPTPYTEAITHFARALGAARSGKPDGGDGRHRAPGGAARQGERVKDAYWAEQVDIQRRVALAWQTFASGKKDEGARRS